MVKTEGGSQPSRYPQWYSCITERRDDQLKVRMPGISEDWKMSIVPRAVWEREVGNTQKYWGPDYIQRGCHAVLRILRHLTLVLSNSGSPGRAALNF